MFTIAAQWRIASAGPVVFRVAGDTRAVAQLRANDFLGRTRLLVLQGTPFCNIDCSYCYLPHRSDRARMDERTLRRAVEWVYLYGLAANPLTVVWHAGEPLTLSPEWYEGAIAQIAAAVPGSAGIKHRLQTNATLIDDRWCALFLAHRFKIGISLDGPAWLHDARRHTRHGRGTHSATMRGMRTLQKHGIPFEVICVVTRETLDAPEELADFFVGAGIDRIGFNIEEIEGINTSSSLADEGTPAKFALFLARFLDRAEKSARLRVREVDGMLNWLRSPGFGHARGNEQNIPLEIITVTHNGDIATFSPELVGLSHPRFGDFTFGNVARTSLDDILNSQRFQLLCKEIADGVLACAEQCPYFRLCRGGAPANKLAEHSSFGVTETLFCTLAEQTVADVVLARLEAQIRGV
jgi:uncharacterized protein